MAMTRTNRLAYRLGLAQAVMRDNNPGLAEAMEVVLMHLTENKRDWEEWLDRQALARRRIATAQMHADGLHGHCPEWRCSEADDCPEGPCAHPDHQESLI